MYTEGLMIYQKLRRVGNSYVVTIPKEEVERLRLEEGHFVALHVQRAEVRPVLSDEIREALEESWREHEAAYRYLKGR
jgi:putative addiction module antidote